jgi:ectoine hydroxylase-related dioxygenase (phytanoyl-CoA dioxygenase family)
MLRVLTTEEINSYRDRGFVRVEALLSEDRRSALCARVDEYTGGRLRLPPGMSFSRQKRRLRFWGRSISLPLLAWHPHSIRKIVGLEHDDLFRTLIFDPLILDPMEQILGRDIKLQRMDLFYKSPRFGWRIGVHQDAVYWPIAPINTIASTCTCFYFLDGATPENGCLGFLPGRHREGPIRATRVDGDTDGERHIDRSAYRKKDKVWVVCKAGDAVFFHGMVPHFSERNHSKSIRRAVAITCLSAKLRYTGYRMEIHGHEDPSRPEERLLLRGESWPGCI